MKINEMPTLFEGAGATQTQKMTHARNHMKNLATKYDGMPIRATATGNGMPGATGTHNGHTWTAKVSYGNASNGETFAKHEYTVDDEKIDADDQWNVHKKFHNALNKPAPEKTKTKKKIKDHMIVTQNHDGQRLKIAVFESNGEQVNRSELMCCEQWMDINEFTNTCPTCGVNYKSNGEPIGSVYNRENDDDDDALSNAEKDVSMTEAEYGLKREARPYKCDVCGHTDMVSTNHTAKILNHCKNCSWKGEGYGPGVHMFGTLHRTHSYTGVEEPVKEAASPDLKATLRRKYAKNEEQNRHSENALLLARHFGTPKEHENAQYFLGMQKLHGYSHPQASQFQSEMSQKYFHKLREGLNEAISKKFKVGDRVHKGMGVKSNGTVVAPFYWRDSTDGTYRDLDSKVHVKWDDGTKGIIQPQFIKKINESDEK